MTECGACNDAINGCEDCQVFTCSRCEKRINWKWGADDEYFSLCDECVVALETP